MRDINNSRLFKMFEKEDPLTLMQKLLFYKNNKIRKTIPSSLVVAKVKSGNKINNPKEKTNKYV